MTPLILGGDGINTIIPKQPTSPRPLSAHKREPNALDPFSFSFQVSSPLRKPHKKGYAHCCPSSFLPPDHKRTRKADWAQEEERSREKGRNDLERKSRGWRNEEEEKSSLSITTTVLEKGQKTTQPPTPSRKRRNGMEEKERQHTQTQGHKKQQAASPPPINKTFPNQQDSAKNEGEL